MNVVIILALVGFLLADIVWERVNPKEDRLDAEIRRRDLMRELRRHDR